MTELVQQRCIPCRGDEPPISEDEIIKLMPQIPEWDITEREGVPTLQHTFKFDDFNGALQFTMKIGEVADEEDHHPILIIQWGKVTVKWSTDAISNLFINDFIMAAKSDKIYSQWK
jgi:4a-hydroxytetrahydrobiopterin dehydratase